MRPEPSDLRLIGFYLGKVVTGLAIVMAIPAVVALLGREWNSLSALLIGMALCLGIGQVAAWRLATPRALTWAHGTVIVALAWLLGPVLAAVPLHLSGHFVTPLDAIFDALSGLTTSGLTVMEDLDHLAWSMSIYRHLLHFVGGQGIVIVVLSLFAQGGAHVATLYASEARDERIVPNIVRTARFIYVIAGTYLLIGTAALTAALWVAGLSLGRAFGHGVALFMAAFDTGGFAPTSQSLAYYHSFGVEVVAMLLMVAGTLSFGLHFQLWRGDRDELWRHLETRTLAVTLGLLTVGAMAALAWSGAQTQPGGLIRTGFVTVISAHTGTGFAVTSGSTMLADWGALAPLAVVLAMALGGMASSTAGGMKAMRIGLLVKGLHLEIRRILLPENALVVQTYHAHGTRLLRERAMWSSAVLLLMYLLTYLVGGFAGLIDGRFSISETIFESVSAAANVGLSVGIVGPQMPTGLQVVYMLQMWLGRLEFIAAFVLIGYVVSLIRPAR